MTTRTEEFVTRVCTQTGERIGAIRAAFILLVRRSWPKPEVVRAFEREPADPTVLTSCRTLLGAFDVTHAEYPTAMFWWKNEKSEFLGFCGRFADASGVKAVDLLGRTDADPAVTWNRQAAIYMRDDREVLASGVPRFDLLERQDRGNATVWLRTSKVPYQSPHGSGTVGGFDAISSAQARQLARKRT
ncbi:MAG: PAS domain-containing protein [Polyangiaceae bacterium]|nr:PAS domain-containing protein [Polyangiaceae bacterium]